MSSYTKWLSKAKNRCLLTGNSKVSYSKIPFSRQALRKVFVHGEITGIRKAI